DGLQAAQGRKSRAGVPAGSVWCDPLPRRASSASRRGVVAVAMASKRRDRARAPARRSPHLEPRKRILVLSEDEHPYLNQALDEARTAGIEVALSNPCFELWLL